METSVQVASSVPKRLRPVLRLRHWRRWSQCGNQLPGSRGGKGKEGPHPRHSEPAAAYGKDWMSSSHALAGGKLTERGSHECRDPHNFQGLAPITLAPKETTPQSYCTKTHYSTVEVTIHYTNTLTLLENNMAESLID